jgi:signal transduction histidine kinase
VGAATRGGVFDGVFDGVSLRAEIEAIAVEIRRICEDLSPSVLANVGLTAALEWALSNAVAHLPSDRKLEHRFVCDDEVANALALAPTKEIQVYRIVQEAITNACRHAGASRVEVTVGGGRDGALVVEVLDDGVGFDPGERRHEAGRGVANIRTRAGMLGAVATWERPPDGGTCFRLVVPGAVAIREDEPDRSCSSS